MADVIGHPIGDIDETFLVPELYHPDREGWYFMPYNSPYYQFISTDFDPDIEEVIQDGEEIFVTGFDVYPMPSGVPLAPRTQRFYVYPSGVHVMSRMIDYWKLFADLDNPYLFVPYFDHSLYGKIVFLDFVDEAPRIIKEFGFLELVLSGYMFTFKEKVVEDYSILFGLKEKLISLLNCDIELVSRTQLKIIWTGDSVPMIEVLMKSIGSKLYGEPIAIKPFEDGFTVVTIDDNAYTFTVRGINQTGYSLNEVTVGLSGLTTMNGSIDLGDYVKIFEVEIQLADTFEIELKI